MAKVSLKTMSWAGAVLASGLVFASGQVWAQESPQTFTYQGRMMDAAGTAPLTGQHNFTLTILDPTGTCILYEETQTNIDLGSTGLFALNVGSNTGATKRTGRDPNLSMSKVFSNPTGGGVLVANGTNCSLPTGYTP